VTVTGSDAVPEAYVPLIVKLPVKLTPPISALLTPVIVYGIRDPTAVLTVFSVTVKLPPSLTAVGPIISE
jgi:hypothetical protein